MSRFRRVLVALLGLIALALVAPWGAPKAVADGDRVGCGTYCESAGQYGGSGLSQSPITMVSSGTVTADPDGYVPVTLTCNRQTQCVGALLLEMQGWDNPQDRLAFVTGRSDLLVNGGATRTIGVPVPASAVAYVRSNGPTPLHVVADVRGSFTFGGELTLAAA